MNGIIKKFLSGKFTFGVAVICILAALIFGFELSALDPKGEAQDFEVKAGDGFSQIASGLESQGLIRSGTAFKIYAAVTLRASRLRPGRYLFSPAMSTPQIVADLSGGGLDEITVVIPEGSAIKDIDAILSDKKITARGEFAEYASKTGKKPEGYFFPDTYRFFAGSEAKEVAEKLLDNFDIKARPVLEKSGKDLYPSLIIASILEKEVPDPGERRIVAGILEKRLKAGWPLQVDSTICYVKSTKCYPLSSLDYKIDSPYNTYLYKGLPPTPIGNPGLEAIEAAVNPEASRFWYYLSDPKTRQTVFAETLDEQNQNKARYLK